MASGRIGAWLGREILAVSPRFDCILINLNESETLRNNSFYISFAISIEVKLGRIRRTSTSRIPLNIFRSTLMHQLYMYFLCLLYIVVGIDEGLELAAEQLLGQESGARLDVPKFLVLFSDGDFMSYYSVSLSSENSTVLLLVARATSLSVTKILLRVPGHVLTSVNN